MREGKFLKKNIDRWQGYHEPTDDPDEQAERFAALIDDLGYCKTHYPTSNTTRFVNGIAGSLFSDIYLNSKRRSSNIARFFVYELPWIFYRFRYIYFFVYALFLAIIALAIAASMYDAEVITAVLGSDYVQMTEQNIKNGQPFSVYEDDNPFMMFLRIAINNVKVGFLMYSSGVLLGLPTLYMLFQNSFMVGAFHSLFIKNGLGWDSIYVIWVHGTLELNMMVVECTAGLMLAFGWLFPGTHTRMHSLKLHARHSIKLVLASVPFTIFAAILESYVTKHAYARLPPFFTLSVLIISWAVVGFYFIWWPHQVNKRGISFDASGNMYINDIKQKNR
jgi:uncharacterized membrane protein SpoIIM required for sporulation